MGSDVSKGPLSLPRRSEEAALRSTGADRAAAGRKPIIVVGASTEAFGGVSAVLKTILANWSSERFAVRHIPTFRDGSPRRKLQTATSALFSHVGTLARGDALAVHVHFSAGASFYRKTPFILAGRMFGVPVVGQAHSGTFPRFYQSLSPLGRRYVRFVLNRLDRLLVLSNEWRRFYADLYPPERIVVVPNPVVLPTPADRRVAGAPVILTMGRLSEHKGTYDILQAIPMVLAEFPETQFWFGGDGELDAVRQRIADQPWASKVRLLGWVDGAEKETALRRASALLLPSYAEGLPMALLEAMAYGVPVVTTPVGGIPQVVAHGRTGLLVTPGDVIGIADAIHILLRDPEHAASLGDAARRLVAERYEVHRVTGQLADIYKELTDGVPAR